MTVREQYHPGNRNVLAIHASTNKPGINPKTGKPWKDATGAFIPEARKFAALHGGTAIPFTNDATPAARRKQVNAILEENRRSDAVAFFCHGLKSSIQTGHGAAQVDALAQLLRLACIPGAPIILYACDSADTPTKGAPGGDGGFADKLRDAMIRESWGFWRGSHVDAHVTTGHTTENPYVRRFTCNLAIPSESFMGIAGGEWIVQPGSRLWVQWRKALKGDLRFRFPFMSIDEIHAELERGS